MARVLMMKTAGGVLAPHDAAASEFLQKLKLGQPVWSEIVRARNTKLHRKWFALLGIAFEAWEPPVIETGRFAGLRPMKDFEQFRKDVTIHAGFYNITVGINGKARVEAQSIAPDRMSQDAFERLYSATINVVLQFLMRDKTEAELNAWVDAVMRFD